MTRTMTRVTRPLVGIVPLMLLMSGCGTAEPAEGTAEPASAQRGLDVAPDGSCMSYCGGRSPDLCWCDAACAEWGDCCPDIEVACDSDPGDPCADFECQADYHCELEDDIVCISPPCSPIPTCVPDEPQNPCSDVLCEEGQHCVLDDNVACIDWACAPIPTCVPDEPQNPCSDVLCEEGQHCVLDDDVVCIDAPCDPVPVCVPNTIPESCADRDYDQCSQDYNCEWLYLCGEPEGTCIPAGDCQADSDCEDGYVCSDVQEECPPTAFCNPICFPRSVCISEQPVCILTDGQSLVIGESAPADDGCNTCTCTEEGMVCTEMACGHCFLDDGQSLAIGESVPADDGCNTCTCTEEWGMACTEMACGCFLDDGQSLAIGESTPADDDCNTCTCTEEGLVCALVESCDVGGSCAGACGGISSDASCWCDAQCDQYGDCCEDRAQICDAPAPECVVGGCNGEVCHAADGDPGFTTCIADPVYACYEHASCELQADGQCGWTTGQQFDACVEEAG